MKKIKKKITPFKFLGVKINIKVSEIETILTTMNTSSSEFMILKAIKSILQNISTLYDANMSRNSGKSNYLRAINNMTIWQKLT